MDMPRSGINCEKKCACAFSGGQAMLEKWFLSRIKHCIEVAERMSCRRQPCINVLRLKHDDLSIVTGRRNLRRWFVSHRGERRETIARLRPHARNSHVVRRFWVEVDYHVFRRFAFLQLAMFVVVLFYVLPELGNLHDGVMLA